MKRDLIIWRMVKVMLIVLGMTAGQNVWADNGWKIEATTSGTTTTFPSSPATTARPGLVPWVRPTGMW